MDPTYVWIVRGYDGKQCVCNSADTAFAMGKYMIEEYGQGEDALMEWIVERFSKRFEKNKEYFSVGDLVSARRFPVIRG